MTKSAVLPSLVNEEGNNIKPKHRGCSKEPSYLNEPSFQTYLTKEKLSCHASSTERALGPQSPLCCKPVLQVIEPLGPYSLILLGSVYIYTRSKQFSLKNKKDLGMACHIPLLKKAKKQGEMPLPSLGPIPLKKCRI